MSDHAVHRIRDAVAASLAAHVASGSAVALALSGGRDSVVLLDALVAVAPARGHAVSGLHVHHGLSANADAWLAFCRTLCEACGVPLDARRVHVERAPRSSLEGEARRARYEALAQGAIAMRAPCVALAHHRDDQAETLLLQLLRGSGPHGLAGMGARRDDPRGVAWWRPLLGTSRADIDAYAAARTLRWVDDESNDSTRHLRNAVRHVAMPAIASIAPHASATLARAAAHQAEAAALADDLAAIDAQAAFDGITLSRVALAALPAHRGRNLVRWTLRRWGLAAPSTARLAAMVAQLASARDDGVVRLAHAGAEIGVYRGRIALHSPRPEPYDIEWRGNGVLELPHGTLAFLRTVGDGIDARRLEGAAVRVRPRAGGERMQLAANRPRRALKSILHDASMPPWEREALPLVLVGGALAAVPGIGVDTTFAARSDASSVAIAWQPRDSWARPRT